MNPDSSQIATIEERLKTSTKRLHTLAVMVGAAKQVVEYDSDRRKQALARVMAPLLRSGESAASAEAKGRADHFYAVSLDQLAEQFKDAQTTISQWVAEQASFEAARSLLSMAKENLKTLE